MGWTSTAFDELLVGVEPDQRYIGNAIPAELLAFSPDYTWYAVDQWKFPSGDYYWQALVRNTNAGIDQQMEGICVAGVVTLLTLHDGAGSENYPAIKFGSSQYNSLYLTLILRNGQFIVDASSALIVDGTMYVGGRSAPLGWTAGASSTAATVASSTGASVAVLTAAGVTYKPGRVYRVDVSVFIQSAVAQSYRLRVRQDSLAGAVLGDSGDLPVPMPGQPGGLLQFSSYVRNTGAAELVRDTVLGLAGGTAANPVSVVTRNAVPAVIDVWDIGSTQDITYGRVIT